MDKDKLIEVLEKKLLEKEAELSNLYTVLERLNSYVNNLIHDTEEGIRSAMSVHRKFATRKIQNVENMNFASRYIISTSNINSPGKFLFLTLMFESYIQVGIKMKRWFHWKYHFT